MQVNIRKKEGVVIFDLEEKIIGNNSLKLRKLIDKQIFSARHIGRNHGACGRDDRCLCIA